MDSQGQEIFDKYQPVKELSGYFDEPIKSVHAGKFHSLFVTESGKLYGLGYNKYGQIGVSNALYLHAEEPVEIFTDGLKIKEVSVGSHHTLLLSEDNRLYGFGARMLGQLDGQHLSGREEQCSITQIELPNGNPRVTSIKAQNVKSQATTEDGQIWFWGGYFYDERSRPVKL